MKKIAFIITKLGGPGWGGAHKVAAMVANHLAESGNEVCIVVSQRSEVDYPLHESISVFCLTDYYKSGKMRAFNLIKKQRAFRKLCKREKIDVTVGFTSNMAIYCVFASMFSKRKALISERTDPKIEPRRKLLRGLRNRTFRFADKIVFQTPGAKEYFPKSVQKKGVIIPNPISPSLPAPYVGEREKKVVNFCRISKQKNLAVLLKAFDAFAKKFPEYTLEIYGNAKEGDAYAEGIYALAKELPSSDKIHFHAACPDVHEKVKNATMFASSADYEGISNSMLEAMAIGLPVIVTDCQNGGERMCIEDGENGFIVPCRDEETLAKAMERVASDSILAEKVSANAVKIRERFAAPIIFEKWRDIVEQL